MNFIYDFILFIWTLAFVRPKENNPKWINKIIFFTLCVLLFSSIILTFYLIGNLNEFI